MGEREEFAVAIKPSAVDANEAVAAYVEQYGSVVAVDDRDAADDLAARFSRTDGTAVAVQAAAPQDDAGVDAYLVPRPDRRTRSPDGSIDAGLTFDLTAHQYGAIGEALILAYDANPPVLAHYVRHDLGLDPGKPLHVAVDPDPAPIVATAPAEGASGGERRTWVPDCRAIARRGPDGRVLREYRCEIKTGGGSLERDQLPVMRAAARRGPVVRIDIDLSSLPDSYTARVRPVEPREAGGLSLESSPPAATRLDEFR